MCAKNDLDFEDTISRIFQLIWDTMTFDCQRYGNCRLTSPRKTGLVDFVIITIGSIRGDC